MNNNIKSVLSAGAKKPEGCYYILDHQPPHFFYFKHNDECNLIFSSSFAPTANMNLLISLLAFLLTLSAVILPTNAVLH